MLKTSVISSEEMMVKAEVLENAGKFECGQKVTSNQLLKDLMEGTPLGVHRYIGGLLRKLSDMREIPFRFIGFNNQRHNLFEKI